MATTSAVLCGTRMKPIAAVLTWVFLRDRISVDPYGLAAQWVTDALNPSVYTYEVAPVFTLLEAQLLREMRLAVGLDGDHGDGLFCPGGSAANLCAMHCARHRCLPNLKVKKQKRLQCIQLVYHATNRAANSGKPRNEPILPSSLLPFHLPE